MKNSGAFLPYDHGQAILQNFEGFKYRFSEVSNALGEKQREYWNAEVPCFFGFRKQKRYATLEPFDSMEYVFITRFIDGYDKADWLRKSLRVLNRSLYSTLFDKNASHYFVCVESLDKINEDAKVIDYWNDARCKLVAERIRNFSLKDGDKISFHDTIKPD